MTPARRNYERAMARGRVEAELRRRHRDEFDDLYHAELHRVDLPHEHPRTMRHGPDGEVLESRAQGTLFDAHGRIDELERKREAIGAPLVREETA